MYRGGIILKTEEQLDAMAAAGQVHARCLKMLAANCRPGVTTSELDAAAEKFIRSQGGTPTFKGYRGFPGSICASPNAMVVHGIPDAYALKRGDILSLDVGVTKDGWVADGAITVGIGEISETATRLLDTTEAALHAAVQQVQPGKRLSDVSHAVQVTVEDGGFEVIRSLVGHGIGRDMHEDPQVPNFGPPGRGPVLEPGMVLAIEPMVAVGTDEIVQGDDGWAVYSADDSLTAHFEFTVAVTEKCPRILTPWHV
jgi:methionyl aminopeptidase